eukprot:12424784-Heterocapsa_arctica.AAC.1
MRKNDLCLSLTSTLNPAKSLLTPIAMLLVKKNNTTNITSNPCIEERDQQEHENICVPSDSDDDASVGGIPIR